MPLCVRSELTFRKFEDCLSLVIQPEPFFDFFEDSDAVIAHHNFSMSRCTLDSNDDFRPFGVIDCIIKHFSKGPLPNIENTGRQFLNKGTDISLPNYVLFQAWFDQIAEVG